MHVSLAFTRDAASIKDAIEKAAEKYAHPFIKECADRQGVTLEQFILACEAGEL